MLLLPSRASPRPLSSSPTTTISALSINHKPNRITSIMSTPTPISSMSSSSSPPIPSKQDPTHQQQEQLLKQVLHYHNQTKHSFTNYARGPRGLDWANQPNPFRRYVSSPLLPLQHPPPQHHLPYHSLFLSPQPPQPLSLSTLSHLLFHSLSLSAWKTTGLSTWSLRVNPSSGNLHPTEAHLISPPIPSLSASAFVAHYAPKAHSMELRSSIPAQFMEGYFPKGSVLVGFSSVFWREAWKYGERAFRYCNHDVGHAIGALAIAAAVLGWDVKILDGLGFSDLGKLMGLNWGLGFEIPARPVKGRMPEIEFEHPDCVLLVSPNGGFEGFNLGFGDLSCGIDRVFDGVEWVGKPNLLSKEHVCWDIIYRTAEAVKKPLTATDRFVVRPFESSGLMYENVYKGLSAVEVIRKRRSAVDMDGVHVMERETFYQILMHCLPSGVQNKQGKQLALPFRVMPWDAEVHAVLFVHRVKGLPMGLYFLVRNEDHFEELRQSTRSEFEWERPERCPVNLPLYRLAKGDFRLLSKQVSCHQDIASDGCFSLGMVARFEQTLQQNVWMYPRLFWETGVLGQVLYLEAHAVGISATGIGCYFDDAVHEILGLSGSNFQSLYHFTVGAPVLDKRIMSLPAYPGPSIDA